MVSVNKNDFAGNIFEFKTGGRSYLFLASNIQVFELDNDTRKVLHDIRNFPGGNVPINYLSAKNPGIPLCDLEKTLRELNGALLHDEASRRTDVDISTLSLTLTAKCNLNCSYCYQKNSFPEGPPISFDVIKRAINTFAKNNPFLRIIFYGGEALLRRDLIEKTVDYCESFFPDTRFRYSIFTNGTLLTDNIIDFLVAHAFEVVVSVDGPEGIRKKLQDHPLEGAFADFEEKIKRLTRTGDSRNLRSHTVITEENANLYMLVPYLYDLGFRNISFAPMTTSDLRRSTLLIEKWVSHLEDFAGNAANRRCLDLFSELNFFKSRIAARKNRLNFCGAGHNYLSVNSRGEFFFCHRFNDNPEFKLGSIHTGVDFKRARDLLTDIARVNDSRCNRCWARNLCAGGCRARNNLKGENTNVPDENYCRLIRTIISLGLKDFVRSKILNSNDGRCYDQLQETLERSKTGVG